MGPEMLFVMYQLQTLSFCLLHLSPSIRVVCWQAEDKNLNHCSLVDLVRFLTTTQLHERQVATWDMVVCFY